MHLNGNTGIVRVYYTVIQRGCYYSRPLPLQATDHPCFARMSQLKLLMSEAVGGGSCFTGLICNQNLSHSCKHDEPEPDCRLAVNSNARFSILIQVAAVSADNSSQVCYSIPEYDAAAQHRLYKDI